MTSATEWERRVRQWRASGKSSEEFAVGKGFTGGGLRYWAHRLKVEAGAARARAEPRPKPRPKSAPPKSQREAVEIARVVRSSASAPPVTGRGAGTIVFEYAETLIAVEAHYDRAALRDLLALLSEVDGRRAR